ncbi:MAG: hypothetical protein HUJ54_14295, partial [Erysipelotrichaceae bacterium]|nr:hypothetical protein [Erysipelotrichaceae bacterium]
KNTEQKAEPDLVSRKALISIGCSDTDIPEELKAVLLEVIGYGTIPVVADFKEGRGKEGRGQQTVEILKSVRENMAGKIYTALTSSRIKPRNRQWSVVKIPVSKDKDQKEKDLTALKEAAAAADFAVIIADGFDLKWDKNSEYGHMIDTMISEGKKTIVYYPARDDQGNLSYQKKTLDNHQNHSVADA